MLFWEVGAQKWALWVQRAMLLCVYMPSVSADLLVNQFLFFNLIFWIYAVMLLYTSISK